MNKRGNNAGLVIKVLAVVIAMTTLGIASDFVMAEVCLVDGNGASCTVDVDGDGTVDIIVRCAGGDAVCACTVDGTGTVISACAGCGVCN